MRIVVSFTRRAPSFLMACAISVSFSLCQLSAQNPDKRSSSQQQKTSAPPAASAQVKLGPKKPSVPRLGVLVPSVQWGQGSVGYDPSEIIRQSVIVMLNGPVIEVVPLQSRIPVQIAAEAKEIGADYVLEAKVTKSQSKGWMKSVGAVAPLASMVPMIGMAGGVAGTVAATTAAATLGSLGAMGSTVQAKDEVTLEYTLRDASGQTVLLANTRKAKAKRDGEDVLTPLVEKAAAAVVDAIVKPH